MPCGPAAGASTPACMPASGDERARVRRDQMSIANCPQLHLAMPCLHGGGRAGHVEQPLHTHPSSAVVLLNDRQADKLASWPGAAARSVPAGWRPRPATWQAGPQLAVAMPARLLAVPARPLAGLGQPFLLTHLPTRSSCIYHPPTPKARLR